MRTLVRTVSFLSLAGLIVPPALYLAGSLGLPAVKGWMLGATLLWFATVPFWMDRRPRNG